MGKQSNVLRNIFLNRPTIKEYIGIDKNTKSKIDAVIKSLEPNKILRVGSFKLKPKKNDFWDLSWGELILLREKIKEKDIQSVIYLTYGTKAEKFLDLDVYNCFSVYKWINIQLDEITKLEIQELLRKPTQEEIDAGVEMLNEFGFTVSLDVLADGNILNYDKILSKPYYEIFKKLCLNRTKNDIQKNYIENASRKNKANS